MTCAECIERGERGVLGRGAKNRSGRRSERRRKGRTCQGQRVREEKRRKKEEIETDMCNGVKKGGGRNC